MGKRIDKKLFDVSGCKYYNDERITVISKYFIINS